MNKLGTTGPALVKHVFLKIGKQDENQQFALKLRAKLNIRFRYRNHQICGIPTTRADIEQRAHDEDAAML
jgi:hypothetical protein